MQNTITLIAKTFRLIYSKLRLLENQIHSFYLFYCNNIKFNKFKTSGIPYVMVSRGGICTIGCNFKMNNDLYGNPIGRPQPCIFFVDKNAKLVIGDNVGISSTALIAHNSITIGNNVKIGGGVCIYDTDFHSINPKIRLNNALDLQSKNKAPVLIEDNVFIGAHSTILKGVTIGENSVIGACAVVTKNIPPNEIWAGNPAKFIKFVH